MPQCHNSNRVLLKVLMEYEQNNHSATLPLCHFETLPLCKRTMNKQNLKIRNIFVGPSGAVRGARRATVLGSASCPTQRRKPQTPNDAWDGRRCPCGKYVAGRMPSSIPAPPPQPPALRNATPEQQPNQIGNYCLIKLFDTCNQRSKQHHKNHID